MAWESIAERKRRQRQDRIPQNWFPQDRPDAINVLDIPRKCGILNDVEVQITESDASTLLHALATGRWSSETVTTAFCKRAAIAQALTNCLTEIFFEDGIARAKLLDDHLKRHGKPFGPLHGLPISLKDSFNVKGYDSSLGVAALCFKPATSNSALVNLLLSLGAVLYCKSNIPQTLSSLDSHNNIFGRTLNPNNRALTAGGSSGGEGALIAMRGSPIGVGTEVGGSIRVPAMANGLVGVKPSHGRIPYAGQQAGMEAGSSKISIEATAGPIARNVKDCALFLRIIADSRPDLVDPDVFNQSWQQQSSVTPPSPAARTPLRIGIIRTDGHVQPLPPIKRVLNEVAQKLAASPDLEVVEVDTATLLGRCVKTFNGIMSIDGANAWFDLLDKHGEPLSPWLQGRLKRRPGKALAEVTALQAQKSALQTEGLAIWTQTGGHWKSGASGGAALDVLICPPAPHPVAPIDGWNTVNYTSAWNLLDWPAGVLPVRSVSKDDILQELDSGAPLNGWDKVNQELWTKQDRSVYLDSPLSVQVIAPRLQERKLVEAMAIIDDVLQSKTSSRL